MLSVDVSEPAVPRQGYSHSPIVADVSQVPLINQHELEAHTDIGKGTYGSVWKATYRGRMVAVKYVKDKKNEVAMKKEIVILHEHGKHSNIVQQFGYISEPTLGYVMEYMACGSLDELLLKRLNMKYTVDHVLSWLEQAASAVAYMHDIPMVHRDLKPHNLLLSDSYLILKLCDFGTVTDMRNSMTECKGSAPWMAPEVFRGIHYDAKCDVYSMGIIFWQMIARREPYPGEYSWQTLMWHVKDGKRPPSLAVHPLLMRMIERCWAGDPSERPTMKALLNFARCLLTVYPRYKEPLVDTTLLHSGNSPAPRSVWSSAPRTSSSSSQSGTLSHRRAGSHETALIRVEPCPPPPVARAVRSQSFIATQRPLPQEGDDEESFLSGIEEHLIPIMAIPGNRSSEEKYNEHMARLVSLHEMKAKEREMLAVKHSLLFRLSKAVEMQRLLRRRATLDKTIVEGMKKLSLPGGPPQ